MASKFLDLVSENAPDFDLEVQLAHKLMPFERRFLLSPNLWRNKPTTVQLNWTSYKFTKENKNSIPEEKGIYMFVVSHKADWIPENNYILYVGQTGYKKPHRTLKVRYQDYLNDQKSSRDRKKINEMLNLWKDDIYFVCSTVPPRTHLGKLEARLTECLIPPYSEGDIPVGEIKKAIKVLRNP